MQVQSEHKNKKQKKNRSLADHPDEIDLQILDLLHEDARITLEKIVEKLPYNPATNRPHSVGTVRNRIKYLEDLGIIEKFTVQISPEKVGYDLTAIISLEIRVSHLKHVDRNLKKIPEIISLYNVTGDDDILAICRLRDREHLNEVIQNILKIEHVLKTKTQIALEILKEGNYLPKKEIEVGK